MCFSSIRALFLCQGCHKHCCDILLTWPWNALCPLVWYFCALQWEWCEGGRRAATKMHAKDTARQGDGTFTIEKLVISPVLKTEIINNIQQKRACKWQHSLISIFQTRLIFNTCSLWLCLHNILSEFYQSKCWNNLCGKVQLPILLTGSVLVPMWHCARMLNSWHERWTTHWCWMTGL